MKNRQVLEAELNKVNNELKDLRIRANKNHTSIYNTEINDLLKRRHNLYTNINQLKMKEMNH